MQRKNDHITEALKQSFTPNDFDKVRFEPVLLPKVNIDEVDLSTAYCGQTFPGPIFINAMTGGTDKAHAINTDLAKLAAKFDLPMASGSGSVALKETSAIESFSTIRAHYPQGFIFANLGADKTPEDAVKVVELLNANALQIHVNAPQEAVMPEGERDFTHWAENIQAMKAAVNIPVVVKGVGFGMSRNDLLELKNLGIETIDVAGSGGTNFITIENARRSYPLDGFNGYGFSTVESLLEAQSVKDVDILASGGIRNAYDVVKALSFGASAVGLSRYFLKLVIDHELDQAETILDTFLSDIRKIMALLGVKNVQELQGLTPILDSSLEAFASR